MQPTFTVSLRAGGKYASGVLTTSQLINAAVRAHYEKSRHPTSPVPVNAQAEYVLTAAHFIRHLDGHPGAQPAVEIRGGKYLRRSVAYLKIPDTDIALLKLNNPAPEMELPALAIRRLRLGNAVVTHGFGGQTASPTPKSLHGRVLGGIPFNFSRDFRTRVRRGALVFNSPQRAIRGDSGGPVLHNGQVYGVQSMISNVVRLNTGIATVANLAPFLPQIHQAMLQLHSLDG